MAAGQPTSDYITAVRHVSAVSIHATRCLLNSRNYDLALDVRVPFLPVNCAQSSQRNSVDEMFQCTNKSAF